MRWAFVAAGVLAAALLHSQGNELRLIEIDPGHSHAAALHATMLPGFSSTASVFAPLGTDLTAHLNRIAHFNQRAKDPTYWALNVYAGLDYLDKFRQEPPGNVVVLSGRNERKIEYIETALRAGQNLLADKPWIVEARDLPRLQASLDLAEKKGLIAYDCMTQRFDPAYRLQRGLLADHEIFGEPVPGTPDAPSVRMRNLHALYKKPSLRPAWYFDIQQQGEGIADVGTHLVDLVEWTLFPDQAIEYRRDVKILRATRRPAILSRAQFEQVTGERAWPSYLNDAVKGDKLEYFTNNDTVFTIRGVHISVSVNWEYEAEPGTKDSYFASYAGTNSTVELREGAAENYAAKVYVIPKQTGSKLIDTLKKKYPHYGFEQSRGAIQVVIPPSERSSDSNPFALLADRFLGYVRNPATLPAWEKPNMITKYYITTAAVKLAREGHL
jgi:predicted dehydrogenase